MPKSRRERHREKKRERAEAAVHGREVGEPAEDTRETRLAKLFSGAAVRGDARIVGQMLSLGVVDESAAKTVLKRAYAVLEKTERASEFTSLFRHVVLGTVKCEIEWMKAFGKFVPQQAPEPDESAEVETEIGWMDAGTHQDTCQMLLELQQAGILDAMIDQAKTTIDGTVVSDGE